MRAFFNSLLYLVIFFIFYKKISKFVSPSACAATIKANAYGLGIDEIAKTLVKSGCREFFVSDIYEGIKLRKILKKNQFEIYALNGQVVGIEEPLFDLE